MNSGYRPEIDGLRAVSVVLVILFHLDPTTTPGGFVGVDVFFVISGYVITRNILHHSCNATNFRFPPSMHAGHAAFFRR